MKNPNCPQNICNPAPSPQCPNNPPHFHDFPNLCPPPAPMPPCNPPAPTVVEGNSLYQAVNNLTNRVNVCISTYNQVMANCYKTLRNLEQAAQENGSYYGPCDVWTEDGYLPDESATYTLIHKNAVDRRNEPIFMQLHLAYGNTTNSMVSQGLASASKITYADKIITAQPIRFKTTTEESGNTLPHESDSPTGSIQLGWYGNAIWQGCPIQTTSEPNLYTVGFTRSGLMRVYNNTATIDQMLRDTIDNAMGCPGVLIQNGQLTDAAWYENIPNYSQQTSRVVMGQNTETREVIILVCGNENNVNKKGMTSQAAAKILLQYGCTIAVELTEDSSAGAMDKGSLLFVPDNDTIPEAYCFWYITRSRFYCNDYERELAELMQNYGETIWQAYLNKQRITNLQSQIAQEIVRATQAENLLQENINAEVNRASDAEKLLQDNINTETNRAIAAEKQLTEQIAAIQPYLDKIENLLDTMAKLDATVAAQQQTITLLEGTISEVKTTIAGLQSTLDGLDGIYLRLSGGKMTGSLNMGNQFITNLKSPVSDDQAATKGYVDEAISEAGGGSYLPLSGGTMSGPIDMKNHKLTNIPAPLGNGDATNKQYVDSAIESIPLSDYVNKNGDTMSGALNMGANKITNLAKPTASTDASTKGYVDETSDSLKELIAASSGDYEAVITALNSYLQKTGGTMTGNIIMANGSKLTGLPDPTANTDSANKKYVDETKTELNQTIMDVNESVQDVQNSLTDYVQKSGSTMTGNLTMSTGAKVTGIPNPTVNTDAAPKQYVDTQLQGKVNKSGDTMTGNLTMSGNAKVTGLPTPTEDSDAATKLYVEDQCYDLFNAIKIDLDAKVSKSGDQMSGGLMLPELTLTNALASRTVKFNNVSSDAQDAIVELLNNSAPTIQPYVTLRGINLPSGDTDAVPKAYVDGLFRNATTDEDQIIFQPFSTAENTPTNPGSCKINLSQFGNNYFFTSSEPYSFSTIPTNHLNDSVLIFMNWSRDVNPNIALTALLELKKFLIKHGAYTPASVSDSGSDEYDSVGTLFACLYNSTGSVIGSPSGISQVTYVDDSTSPYIKLRIYFGTPFVASQNWSDIKATFGGILPRMD